MRWSVGIVLLLLALGTLRVVGCGDEDPVPEYPRCLSDEQCDDGDPCSIDHCNIYGGDGYCEHRDKPCELVLHEDCGDIETYYCDPDTGAVECTLDTAWVQGQSCCNEGGRRCWFGEDCFLGICCTYECTRGGYCIDGACVEGNGYPSDCTDRDDGTPCEVGDTIGLCWKGRCAVLDCTGLSYGTLCWFHEYNAGECRPGVVGDHRCFHAEPSGGGPPGWTCSAEYYGTGDGCDCGCGVLDLDCADGTVASCDYCALSGSCSFLWCPGDIDPAQNWHCGAGGGTGGSSGTGGSGGAGGTGGSAAELCEGVTCQDTECKSVGVCDPSDGVCDYEMVAADGTACSEGECLDGVCAPLGAVPCTEQGIHDAIAQGGGPHFFACDGPTTVVTTAEIAVDNDVILDGEGNLTVDANDAHRVFSVAFGATAELRGMTVTGGSMTGVTGEGGGIHNAGALTVTNSTVSGNTAGDGGGIHNDSQSVLTVTNSRVFGNSASRGGGIFSWGTLTVTNTTVSGNSAVYGGGGVYNGGGGIVTNSTVSDNSSTYEGGGMSITGALTVTNSTVSGNSVRNGGGIYLAGTLTVTNSTVSGNTASGRGGGIYNSRWGELTVTNSTVSGNSAEWDGSGVYNDRGRLMLTRSLVDGDCGFGTLIPSGGYNIESPGDTCHFDPDGTDLVDVPDPLLGPLQDNGGPTMTHALGEGSVAIDVIPEEDCVDADGASLLTDQRGELRPVAILGPAPKCDVGAFEVQP